MGLDVLIKHIAIDKELVAANLVLETRVPTPAFGGRKLTLDGAEVKGV